MTIGHNGGPALDEPDFKLRWVRINVTELLEGIEGLNIEQRGFYLTALFRMYARGGSLPASDREGSVALRCDVRQFRRLRDQMLSLGKIYQDGNDLRNSRVEREITMFVLEVRRRREAAIKREEAKRIAAETRETSAELLPEVPVKFRKVEKNETKNGNKINETIAEPWQTSGGNHKPETINQKPYKERKEEEVPLALPAAVAAPPVPVVNGSHALEAFVSYNALAQRIGLPLARTLTPQRRKNLEARLREHGGAEAWTIALANIERSAFLRGQNSRGWRVDFDFLLQARSFAKVVDGTYGNGAHGDTLEPVETRHQRSMRLMQEAADQLSRRGVIS